MNERHYERKFYHDLLNLASSSRGISELIKEVDDKTRSEMLALLGDLSETMIETINTRRHYCNLVANDLRLHPSTVDCEKLLKSLRECYARHTLADNKEIRISSVEKPTPSHKISLTTDKDILQNALGYGIRTALETIAPGQAVSLGLKAETRKGITLIDFTFTFPGSISEEAKAHVFMEPVSDERSLTGHDAYVFYTLITVALKGSASWATEGDKLILCSHFEENSLTC
jgi:hypothetical protein